MIIKICPNNITVNQVSRTIAYTKQTDKLKLKKKTIHQIQRGELFSFLKKKKKERKKVLIQY